MMIKNDAPLRKEYGSALATVLLLRMLNGTVASLPWQVFVLAADNDQPQDDILDAIERKARQVRELQI